MEKLREEIERNVEIIKSLSERKRCNQISNTAGCCYSDYVSGSKSEIEEIKFFLNSNIEIKNKVRENFKDNKKCFFHDKTEKICLIEKIKPLSCRYVAYKIYDHNEVYKYCSPLKSCKEGCSTILSSEKKDVEKYTDKIYTVIIDEKKYYYLNCKEIDGFEKYINEKKIKLKDMLEEEQC